MAGTTVGSIVAKLMLNIDNFSSNLSKIQSDIEATGKKLDGLDKLGSGLTSVGQTLTTSLTLPIVGVGTAATKLASDFEYSMSQVKAISGATGDEFTALEDAAIKLGGSTKFSAGEVADAMTEMAKAGWTTQQILDGMSGVLDAAAASGEGLGTVSTIVADAITGFGLAASDSSRVADLLTQAANSGTIGINDLGESFKYIAPVASALGFSIEEATTAIAAMSMAGIKGSQAGTSLKNMLTNLVKPTDPMQKAMDKLGISVTNSAGEMKSLDDILANLRDAFSGLTEAEKAKYAATLAGKEGMSGMLALLNMNQNAYDDITHSMITSSGVAQKTAEVMQDNLQSALEQLGGAVESLAIRLGKQLIPAIRKIAEKITEFTEKLAGANEEQIQMAIKIGLVVAAIGPAIAIVGKLISAFVTLRKVATGIKSGFMILKGAILGLSAPVVAIVAIVGTLIAAFATLWQTNEDFRNSITEIWNGIKETFANFFARLTEMINSLGFDFENFSEVLKALWQGLCDFLGPVFIGVFQFIADTIQVTLDVILGIFDFFVAVFTGDWEGAWNAISGIFTTVWEGMVAWLENIGNTMLGILDVICGWFGTTWEETWGGIKTFFVDTWNSIVEFFNTVGEAIMSVLSPILEEVVGAFQMAWDCVVAVWNYAEPFFMAIWEGIKAVFSVVAIYFETVFSLAWTQIKAVWDTVVAYFTLIWENIKAVFQFVATWFGEAFKLAWVAIKSIWDVVVSYFAMVWAGIKAVFAVVKGVLTGNFSDAWEAIKNVWEKAKGFFSSIWNAIKNIFSATKDYFKNTFSAAWEAVQKVFSNWGTFFKNLWNIIKNTFVDLGTKIGEGVAGAVKAGINGVIGMIENTVNGFIGLINGAVDLINAIPGVDIGKISKLKFPRLAKGGIVDKPTFAEIGEDGREAVVPLEKNLGWLDKLSSMLAGSLMHSLVGALTPLYNTMNQMQAAMAGAYGSVFDGAQYGTVKSNTDTLRDANNGGSIYIEKIEVRDDNDIEQLTQGLYNHNDKSLRALGRRAF